MTYPLISIKVLFTAECCNRSKSFDNEYDVARWLLAHIRIWHKRLRVKIEKAARNAARSQNGCGYFDGHANSGDGWHKAQGLFREAWRINAVKDYVRACRE